MEAHYSDPGVPPCPPFPIASFLAFSSPTAGIGLARTGLAFCDLDGGHHDLTDIQSASPRNRILGGFAARPRPMLLCSVPGMEVTAEMR